MDHFMKHWAHLYSPIGWFLGDFLAASSITAATFPGSCRMAICSGARNSTPRTD
jgi:hypothetical protein